ncbi:MAG: hypothetical protein RL197_974 [Actinomycetota bacterium]|jgi:alpha-tubulin suppressor-like RCC1 family protein
MVALFAILAVAISFLITSTAQAAPPVNTAAPSINAFTGYGPTNNRTATVTAGTWTDDETPTLTYQWYRCFATGSATTTLPSDCYIVNNRTNSDYGINQTDIGWYLRVAETATNSGGSVTVYSATTNRVLASRILSSWYTSNCAIKNGGVWCWGSNINGQLGDNSITQRTSPVAVLKSDLTPLSGAVAVATSNTHTCAVTDDQSLWCWGANAAGQLGDGTTTASRTAVKVKASLGVDLSNIVDVAVAGDASNSQTSGYTCAINASGALFCWGLNSSGQLGTGNTTSVFYPTAVTDMASGVNQVAINDKSACAIKNGGAFCWGLNGSGQLGIGNTTNKTTPTAVTTLTSNTTGITMGALSACAIRAGGAFCWGDNVTGNLGTGNTTLSNVPVAAISTSDAVPVSLSTGVIDIASNENSSNAPYNSTCFLKESGAVICTGYNQFRQLTNNSNVQSNTPVRSVYYTSNVTEIDMGQYSFCAIMSGAARCLGATPVAGDGTGNSPSTPSNVTGMTGLDPESYRANISSSAFVPPTYVGTGHSIVSATPTEFSGYPSPSVSYSWLACDDNVGGSSAATPSSCSPIANATSSSFILTSAQFGKHIRLQSQATNTLGTKSFVSAATIASGTPPSASGGSNYSGSQAAGPLPGLALSSSTTTSFTGTPMPTGSSAWVRCATEVTTTTYSGIDGTLPSGCSLISGATSATYKLSQADVGFYVSPAQIATTSAGQSVAFGPSTAIVRGGQRVAMSMSHTCAIKSGLVYCWGTNTNGQLGSGNTTSTTKPSEVPVRFADGSLLKDAIAVSVTTAHSCALTNDGSVYCWGINSKGQLGNGTTTQQNFPVQVLASAGTPFTGATAVATGGDNTCVIKSAQLYCFGGNTSGQIGKGVVEASTNYTYPLLNTALSTGVQRVTMAAQNTTCALKLAQAYCWGFQGLMLLGFPSASAVATPTLLAVNGTAFSNVSTITLGGYAGCLVSSSVLHCWGGATTGANGFGGNMTSPTRVSGMPSNITQIVSSPNTASASTCFTTISETVYCAGGNDYGNYLYNHASSGLTSFRLTTTISGISEIANGDRSTCFVANKALKCVGFNGSGQVGIGSSQPTYYPGTPSGMDKYVGYEDLAPVLSVSTTGFTTPSATLLGKAEAADGRQTFGFPYPSLSSSWNTCTEIGAAANSLPADCSPTPSAVGDALSLSNDDLGSKFRYSVTASNAFGAATRVTATLGPVQSAPTSLASNPAIGPLATPVPLVGHPISATPSEVSAQGIVTHVYQWYRCTAADASTSASLPTGCTLIPEGTTRTYQVRPEDTGSFLRFSDTAKSPAGDLVMWSPTTSSYAIDGQSIASNGTVTCAIRQGMVQCWGASGNLQGDGIGLANLAPKNYVSISAGVRLTEVASISVGTDSACAVTVNGALYCWGLNTNGVLGDGTLVGKVWATPVSPTAGGVTFSSGVMQVSVGHVSVCALKYGGAVYCWGLNTQNVLGNSSLSVNTKYTVPQETNRAASLGLTNTGVTRVSVNTNHVCIIQGGFLYCAGYGGYGQLMNGANGNNTTFDKFISSNTFWANGGFTDVATSGNTSCFIQSGAVRCVGQANLNQIGTTITTVSGNGMLVFNDELWSGAVSVSGFKDITGNGGFCANKLDANYCWGVNSSAQAWGLTSTPLTTPTKLPVFVNQLALGQGNSCGLIGETLTCVGLNTTGALGNGTNTNTTTPVATSITSGIGTYLADPAAVTQSFTGTLANGSVLTAAQMPFTGYPRPTMSYQWYRCLKAGNSVSVLPNDCFAISGATSETYTVTASDLGKRIRFGATGVVGGTTLRNFSAASVAVGVAPTSVNGSLKLIGTTFGTQVGTTFQQSRAVFNGAPAPSVSYKWLRCKAVGGTVVTALPANCIEIPGATSISYTTTISDINFLIRGQQIATNEIGTTTLITATTGVINEGDRIAVADGTTCVVKDGAVWCVGAGTRGQLGNGTWVDSNVPVQVKRTVSTNLTNVRHITGAGTHFCAITWNSQAVFCWGSNTYGELGFTAGTDYNYATQVTGVLLTSIVGSLSLGPTSACATTTNGLICWGNRVNGLLGNGLSNGSQSNSAAPSGFSSDSHRVSVGASSACGIKLGALFCWGLNNYGQVGDGTTTTRLTPVAVSGATSGVSDVAVGSSATCAVINGAAKCWGNNDFGQLGNGTNSSNATPTTITSASDGTSFDSGVTDISMSSNVSSQTQDSVCVTKSNGAVYCFGYNGEGQLLNGETTSTNSPKPALVATSGVTSVAVGSDHSCFIKDNSAYCSGANSQGQLLDSTTTASAAPVNVSTFSSMSAFGVVSGAATTAPSIFGTTARVGKPIQSDPGVVNVSPPPTYNFLWYSCTTTGATATTSASIPTGCTVATGPTANTDTYTPVAADKDKYLRMYVGLVQGGTTYPSFTATSAKVLPGEPEITFNPLPGPIIVGGDAVQLTPVSSTGNTTFSYLSSTPSLCSITNTGMISGVSAGICDIAVTQAAAGAFDAVTVTFSAVTGPGEQVITFPQPDPTEMRSSAYTPTVSSSSGLAVSLTSSTPSVCTASGTSVTLVSLGTCTISADQAGTSAYYPAPTETRSFEIIQGSQTLSLDEANLALTDGTYSLPATSSAGLTPTYTTSSSNCSITGTTLNLLSIGSCLVLASQPGNDNYAAATDVSATFRIVGAPELDVAPEITGNPVFGVLSVGSEASWTGAGTVSVTRQWYVCTSAGDAVVGAGNLGANAPSECTVISGATNTSFTPTANEVGKRLRLAEQASNVLDGTTNFTSAFTAASAVVAKQSQTITFEALPAKTYGDSEFLLTATSDRSLTISFSSSNSSVCTISGATLTISGAGTCDVTASQAGDAGTLAANVVVQTLTVSKASQTITLPNFTSGVYGGVAKVSGATSSSGLAVTLTSADITVCTVSGLNVNIVAPGTCSITASQAGSTNYSAATDVTKSFTISKADQTITFTGSVKQLQDGDFALTGTTSSGLPISYATNTPSVCDLSGSSVVVRTVGTCTITATRTSDANYNAAVSVSASFTIESIPVQTNSVAIPSAGNYRFGTAITATAGTWTGTPTITYSRAWYRCDTPPSISVGTGLAATLAPIDCAAIAGATGLSYTPVLADIGKYLAIAETATNTTSAGSNNRTTFVATSSIVEKQTQSISFAALAGKSFGDSEFSLSATTNRSLTVSFVSSNTAVCSISGVTVTIVGAGSCEITASQAGNSSTLSAADVVRTLTVSKANQTISLNTLANITYRGTPTTLAYSATSGLDVSVVSGDTAVCTVSGTVVSVVAVGACSITASQEGTANWNAATSVTKTFTISKHQDTLTFAGATKQFRSGDFTLTSSTLSGAAVSYVSNSASICTVSGAVVTPVTHGACSITATAATNSNYTAPAAVTATFTIERAVEQSVSHSITSYATYWFDQGISYTAGTWVGSGTVSVSRKWYSCTSSPTVAVVSGTTVPNGCVLVTETSAGVYKPVASDIGKYIAVAETGSNVANAVTNTSTSWIVSAGVVTKLAQTITFAPLADKTYGNIPFVLSGSSSQSLPISYVSSDEDTCTVSGSTVSIVRAGTCDITASQLGNSTVAPAASVTRTLTINKATQAITFAALANVTYSSAKVTLSTSASSTLPVTVASDDSTVCSLSGALVTLLKAGTCSITASQAGNANYESAATVTRTFQISKAGQSVTFTIPEFLSLGLEQSVALNGASSAGLEITYAVSDSAVCSVHDGQLVGNLPGTCSITATQAGDDRYLPASVTRSAMVADYALVESMIPIGPEFTNSTSTGFTITFDGAISGFTAADLTTVPAGACEIGEPAPVGGNLAVYSVELSNCAEGPVVLKVAANSISNGAPGPALDSVGLEPVTVDFAFRQTLSLAPQFSSPTNDLSLDYSLFFAEPVLGFEGSDVLVSGSGSNGCVASVTGSGSDYVVALTGCAEGSVMVGIAANSVTDLAGNSGPSAVTNSSGIELDLTAPQSPVVSGLPAEFSRPSEFTANFSVVPGNTYDCTLNGVALAGCDGSLVLAAESMTAGNYNLEVWATDAAGNESVRYSHSWTISNYLRPSTPAFVAQPFERTSYNHLIVNWAEVTAQSQQLQVTGLLLEYSTNGTTWTTLPELSPSTTNYDLEIQSGSNYSFRLRALSGPFQANASDWSAVGSYTAVYKPALLKMSTSSALLKPTSGATITLTGTDLRDYAVVSPNAITGSVVTVTDSAGKVFTAKVTLVTPTSIRFVVPTTSKIGAATIRVTVGTGVFQSTPVTRSLNIVAKKINQTITFTPPTSLRFSSPDIQANATLDSFATPVYAIEPASIGVCSVSPTGLIRALKGGLCKYKISASASDAFNAYVSPVFTTAITRLNVETTFELPQTLLDVLNDQYQVRIIPETFALSAVADSNIPNTVVKISSSPETTCFVDGENKLHIVGVGTCTITALAENDYYRTEVPVTRSFEVLRNDQALTFVQPGTSLGLLTALEATDSPSGFQLLALLDSGLTPNFESVNSEICSVDATGIVIWSGDLVKFPTQKCQVKISHDGDANFGPIEPRIFEFGARHLPPLAPVGGWIREPDGALAVGRTGGLAASGGDGVAVVVVSGNKITVTPFSKGMYIGPITATITIPYYVPVKNVMTLKKQVCTVKWGVLKKMKGSDPTAFKVKKFGNKKYCAANKDAVNYFAQGNRLLPTIVVKRDRRWPTTYLSKMGSNGKGQKIYPAVKTWHLTIG